MATLFRILPVLWLIFGLLMLIPFGNTLFSVWRIRLEFAAEAVPAQFLPLAVLLITLLLFLGGAITNGILMLRHRARRVSLVLSSILCLTFPIGTLLGIISWIALTRPEIKARYAPVIPE